MSWISVTASDVLTRLTAREAAAFREKALGAGQADPLVEITAQVVDEIRGHVGSCSRNTLGPAGTIPPRLLATAVNIIRYRLATRLPGMSSLIDELRRKEYEDALSLLRRVADGSFAVEDPAGDATSVSSPTPRITPRRRRFRRQDESGV